MKNAWRQKNAKERRAITLAAIILLQAVCAMFFIGDIIMDTSEGDHLNDLHSGPEAIAAVALVLGVLYMMVELRRLLARMNEMDASLKVARGQMANVAATFFKQWELTNAEKDVAIMIMKGVNNETIARVRGTAPGTVRTQATRVYAKSGVEGRAQFISLFMEELFVGGLGYESGP